MTCASGQNDIDSQFLDFKAELQSSEVVVPGDNQNPLTGDVIGNQYRVKVLSKPMKKEQVLELAEKNKNSVQELKDAVDEKTPSYLEELKADESRANLYKNVKQRVENLKYTLNDLEIGKTYNFYANEEYETGVLLDVKFSKKDSDPSKYSKIR